MRYFDFVPPEALQDYQARRWLRSLPTLGWFYDGFAYLIIVNKQHPHLSYILKEKIPIDN